jgi:hypothetical protein
MASVVDICNGALNQLGATTILSLTEIQKMHDCATQDTHKLEIHYLDHILGTVYKKELN